MLYEIKSYEKMAGKEYRKSFLVDNLPTITTNKNGCKKLRFKQGGKKSYTYLTAEACCFHDDFKLIVTESTTGIIIYDISK